MMLEDEFNYYRDNQAELLQKFNGKYIVIVGHNVAGAYNSRETAYKEALKKYKLGTFLIQQCSPGDSSYTETFHSRAVFN